MDRKHTKGNYQNELEKRIKREGGIEGGAEEE